MITAKYYLQNADGDRYSLNVGGNMFCKNVSGLGISFNSDYADSGDGFFIRTKKSVAQDTIMFDIVILTDAMTAYKSLVDWIAQAGDLYFVYNPSGAQDFYRRVQVQYLTKTYRNSCGVLIVPCALSCLTPWYTLNNVQIQLTQQTGDAFRFPFTFDSNLYFGSSNIGNYAADITGTGHIANALRVVYSGEASNPVISLSEPGGLIAKCKVTATMVAGDTLEMSSEYSDSYVRLTHGGVVTDLIDSNAVDITFNPFCRVPVGQTCTIQIAGDSALNGTASCTIISYYRSV